jgi:hypothetical protein
MLQEKLVLLVKYSVELLVEAVSGRHSCIMYSGISKPRVYMIMISYE